MREDHKLQAAVQAHLDLDPAINSSHIGVSAREGIVMISGHVPSLLERSAAERAAGQVKGVRAVINELVVELPGLNRTSDEQIAERAYARLASNVSVPLDRLHLAVKDGRITVAGTDRSLTFRDVARAVYLEMGRIPSNQREELSATRTYDPVFGTAATAAHIAVVDIDPETYRVKVERFLVAEDCGKLINPMIVDGQVHGGVAQGIGAALYEEMIYNDEGQNVTASLVDYVVPSATEIPSIGVVHIEAASLTTLGGFRGMGEGGTIGAPAAVANAVADALAPLGIEVFELPVTPERLFRLIENAKSNR